GWVPPVRASAAKELVSFDLAIASYAWHRRARVPLAAGACLVLFVVSTAVAVTETQTPDHAGALGLGQIATLDSFLDDRSDRFAMLLVDPVQPSERSRRFFARLQRTIDTTPAGRRTIGTTRGTRRGVLGSGAHVHAIATARLGEAISSLSGSSGEAGISQLMAESLELTGSGSRDGMTPRAMPSGSALGAREVLLDGAFTGQGRDYALGKVLGNRAEPEPHVDLETAAPVVEGPTAIPDETIRKIVRAHRLELRGCYERELRRASGLRTRIELGWTLGADGSVHEVRVRSAAPRWPALEECLVAAVSSWKFPAPPGGSTIAINYPVVFRPMVR
ncbi:MAG: AgmX/PglI C-terminal domain-containing protein, partial [Myxococcota bacterium]